MVLAILDALATALASLDPTPNQVWPRMNGEPDEPCIDIYPSDPFEDTDERGFTGSGALNFVVRARIGVPDRDEAQDFLLQWMDPTNPSGVVGLLEGETLSGLVTSVDVGAVSGYVSFVDLNGKIQRIGAQWIVRVMPAHS